MRTAYIFIVLLLLLPQSVGAADAAIIAALILGLAG